MPRPVPNGPPPAPVAQRLVIRYAKRGRMRFASHRDIARAIERGVRKAGLPVAFSAGFSPHPKISYAGGAPTGTASEAEYLEISLTGACPVSDVRDRLDAALPDGIDVIEVLELADGPGRASALRLEGSQWRVILPGVAPAEVAGAVQAFLAAESIVVERLTNKGLRRLDARAAVVTLELERRAAPEADARGVILRMVVRHVTPAVRPDDILAGLSQVASTEAALTPSSPPLVTRLAQGPLGTEAGTGALATQPARPVAAGQLPRSRGGAAAEGQKLETRLGHTDTVAVDGTAAYGTAVCGTAESVVSATAYEQLLRGANGPVVGPRAREYDGRLPGCSKPSDSTENRMITGRPPLATPLI
jgi:radical SAM-linked protein